MLLAELRVAHACRGQHAGPIASAALEQPHGNSEDFERPLASRIWIPDTPVSLHNGS